MDYQRKIVYFCFFAVSALLMVIAAVAMYVLFAPVPSESAPPPLQISEHSIHPTSLP